MNVEHGVLQVHKEMQHSYIDHLVNTPIVSEIQFAWIHLFLSEHHISAFHKSNEQLSAYVSAICLVQAGLDVHDTIRPDVNSYASSEITSMQLHVLQGDYYSSKFYALLAKTRDFEGISDLCLAIMAVNREKVQIRHQVLSKIPISLEQYAHFQTRIRMNLFEWFSSKIKLEKQSLYVDGLQWIARRKWLFEEKRSMEHNSSLSNDWFGKPGMIDWVWNLQQISFEIEKTNEQFRKLHNDPEWLRLIDRLSEDEAFHVKK